MMYPVSCKPDQISQPELVATTTCNPAALGPIQLQRQSGHTVKKSPKYSGLSYHPSSATDHHCSQNIGWDKPCVLNLSALRYESLWATQKGSQRELWGEKWVTQGTQSQRQVWFPGWNVSWLKWFISTSLEHTCHMLPFALRRSPCLRAGNRQWSENMARHWTDTQSLK